MLSSRFLRTAALLPALLLGGCFIHPAPPPDEGARAASYDSRTSPEQSASETPREDPTGRLEESKEGGVIWPVLVAFFGFVATVAVGVMMSGGL